MLKMLYVCHANTGGIAEYAIRQVAALAETGVEVVFLCRPGFPTYRVRGCCLRVCLPDLQDDGPTWKKIYKRIRDSHKVAAVVTDHVYSSRAQVVLIACYSEYFSPFWAHIYRRQGRRGIRIGTIAHDPVRDYVLGPRWWHRWSVREGYSFITDVFVHDYTPIDFGGPKPPPMRVHRIPHGPFETTPTRLGRESIRAHYGFGESDRVFLAFGQIRDGKNLDRFLRSMVALPCNVKLLVAGSSGGGSQRPPEDYQALAQELGVTERCAWDLRYIPDEDTADVFAASDFVLMTYSSKFRSASGVLNTAVTCRKPVLASSGDGPLKSGVQDYGLGIFVTPDDDSVVLEGACRLLSESVTPEWDRYEQENSWAANARGVLAAWEL